MRKLEKRVINWRKPALVTAAACLVAGSALADRVTMRNGRVLDGAIVRQTATELVIRTEVGNIVLNRADISTIETSTMVPEEVDGDTAFARKQYEAAAKSYAAALEKLQRSGAETDAVKRVEDKIAEVNQALQTQAGATLVQQLDSAQALAAGQRYGEAEKILESLLPLAQGGTLEARTRRLLAEVRYALAGEAADRLDSIAQERYLKKAIEADETYHRAHLAYGDILLRSAATEKLGLEEILRGLKYGEGTLSEEEVVKYHYLAATKFYDQRDYARAATNFIEALRGKDKYPAYADALDKAAKSYVKLSERNKGGDFRETIDILNEALRLDPRNTDARFLLGSIYLDQGHANEAIAELTEVATLNPTYPRVHRNLGRAYLALKDYEPALEHLALELKSEPNSYEVLVDRAAIYILLAEYEKARQDLTKAITIEPTRWNAYLKLAELAGALEQYDEARGNLAKVLSLKPDAVEAYVQMGNILVKQKNYPDAKKWYNEVIQYLEKLGGLSAEYRKLMAEAQTQLGVIDFEQDSPRQAETRFVKALEFVPDYANALSKVGDVKRRLGEEIKVRESKEAAASFFQEAENFYKRAIQADPRSADLYLSLGILYHQSMKDAAQALPNYMAYLSHGGRNAEVVKWVEEVGGNGEEAMALLAKNDSTSTGTPTGEGTPFPGAGEMQPALALSVTNVATTDTLSSGPAEVSAETTAPATASPGANAPAVAAN